MKIKFGGRMLRELDGREDAVLLCINNKMCCIMEDKVVKLGINLVNKPISYENAKDTFRANGKKVYVDEGRLFLEKMFSNFDVEKINFRMEME
jgi:hypothetical protein